MELSKDPLEVRKPTDGAVWKILALKLGEATRDTGMCVFLTDFGVPIETYYYLWCLQAGDEAVLVDTGFTSKAPQSQAARELTTPVEQLRKIHVEPEQITTVILSHLHWDHAGGLDFFPNARFYVQMREYEFFTEHPFRKALPYQKTTFAGDLARIQELREAGRVEILDGPAHIRPGISVMLAPGHTPGLQVTLVNTSSGVAAVSSDCCHLFRNVEEHTTSCIITDMIAWLDSFERLKNTVSSPDLIFPGHDAQMITRFPRVSDGVSQLVG